MSKPAFDDLYTWSGRRNRHSYLAYQFASIILGGMALFGVWTFCPNTIKSIRTLITTPFVYPTPTYFSTIDGVDGFALITLVVFGAALLISNLAVTSQRCRDFGWSGWLLVILFVPYIGRLFQIGLYVVPSQSGKNRFGPDMRYRHRRAESRHRWSLR